MTTTLTKGNGDGFGELQQLVDRINTGKPSPDDLVRLRAIFEEHPKLWAHVTGLFRLGRRALCESTGNEVSAIVCDAQITGRQDYLGFADASPLERLLISEVVLCEFQLNRVRQVYHSAMGEPSTTVEAVEHVEKRLSVAQRRFLSACETLAKVRKLNLTIQVNIAGNGGQQVNAMKS